MEGFSKEVYKVWIKAFWKKIDEYLEDLCFSEEDKDRIRSEIDDYFNFD